MPIEGFIISVFCEIEVLFKAVTRGIRLRRGSISRRFGPEACSIWLAESPVKSSLIPSASC